MTFALRTLRWMTITGIVGGFPVAAHAIEPLNDDALGESVVVTPGTWFSTLDQAHRNSIYWIGDWETGNTSQWDNGQPWVSGPGTSSWHLVTNSVHSGSYAMSTTIDTTGGPAGVRWPRRDVPGMSSFPTAAYYSTWLRFDTTLDASWYNMMQWKQTTSDGTSSDPVWSIDIEKRTDGRDYYYLYSYIGNDGNYLTPGIGDKGDSSIAIPIGQWTHLETYYKWASDTTGAVSVYQDGKLILQQTGVRTKFVHADAPSKPLQWTINAYGDDVTPSPNTVYFDDAAISALRLGDSTAISPMPGDFDGNGTVDAADYAVWRKGLPKTYSQSDYNLWRDNFGDSAGSGVGCGRSSHNSRTLDHFHSLYRSPHPLKFAISRA